MTTALTRGELVEALRDFLELLEQWQADHEGVGSAPEKSKPAERDEGLLRKIAALLKTHRKSRLVPLRTARLAVSLHNVEALCKQWVIESSQPSPTALEDRARYFKRLIYAELQPTRRPNEPREGAGPTPDLDQLLDKLRKAFERSSVPLVRVPRPEGNSAPSFVLTDADIARVMDITRPILKPYYEPLLSQGWDIFRNAVNVLDGQKPKEKSPLLDTQEAITYLVDGWGGYPPVNKLEWAAEAAGYSPEEIALISNAAPRRPFSLPE